MTDTLFAEASASPFESGALISEDGRYRYRLWRRWDATKPTMAWIMLNPSTANADEDDPTIRRCIGFAKREGCGGIEVVNLYGRRATDPRILPDLTDPEGPENALGWAVALHDPEPALVVAGWGAAADALRLPPSAALRGYAGPSLMCLGATKQGFPRHPLYVRSDKPLVRWEPTP